VISSINTLTPLPDSSQLIAQNGRPEWKITTSVTWSKGNWRSGLSTQYVSEVNQTTLLSDTATPWVVEDQLITNLYVQYEFEKAGLASNSKVRLGVRDLFDKGPSLADGGYLGAVQRPYGRYWYVNVAKTF
jgi:iron complex outermembrane recepter protein